MLFVLLIGLTGAAMAQFNQGQQGQQAQAARREDRDLVESELRDRISRDERRDCQVQVERAETYYISRTESGIRGRARVSTNRAEWRNARFEGVIDLRRNIISSLRWDYDTGGGLGGDAGGNYGGAQSGVLRSGRYELQLVATDRLLSVGNDGRTVVQSSIGGRSGQWDFEDAGNGYYYIRSTDTGDAMTVQGRGENGDTVVLARLRRGDESQLWQARTGPDNGYCFTTPRGKSLDSPSSARQDGGRMQIYSSNCEANQRFRLRLINESRFDGNDRGRERDRYNRDRDTGGPGGLTWRGRVDDVIVLEIRDRTIRDRVISGRQAESVRYDFNSSLPNREANVTVDKRRGRGEVRVVEQPSRRNGYTAVIQIRDSSGGADEYEIEVRWN
jgi:hypothetical protein